MIAVSQKCSLCVPQTLPLNTLVKLGCGGAGAEQARGSGRLAEAAASSVAVSPGLGTREIPILGC